MTGYLLKILTVLGVSNFVIYLYYFVSVGHKNSYTGTVSYIVVIFFLYLVYRAFIQWFTRKPEKLMLTISTLLWFFLAHLFILCCFFFQFNNVGFQSGFILFLTIIFYSLLPIFIFFLSYGAGDTLLQRIPHHHKTSKIFQFLSGLGIGFFVFISLLVIVGQFGAYTLYSVIFLLVGMVFLGYESIWKFLKFIAGHEMHFENDAKKPSFSYLTSSEFLFFVLTLLISVNLISIVRPVPIGWDDLGVYMNYPHLMAQAGDILSLGSMYAWQVFTGIGFMTGSATQAFFFNSIGGSMCFLVIYLVIKDLFSSSKSTFLNIPLLLVTTLAAMPMMIFQLAKDMKLDPGLLFVSGIALYIVYYTVLHVGKEKKHEAQRYIYFFVAALLIGFAFTIKFTSLLLLSGVLAGIFYHFAGMKGLFGYLGFYIAIFTKLGLWGYMNISYPREAMTLINTVSLISLGIGILCFSFLTFKGNIKIFQKLLQSVAIIIVGFFLAISPWLVKNIIETAPNINIGTLLSGRPTMYTPDFTTLYSQKEIEGIQIHQARQMSASGTTTNEDFGRYFGYEKGINNYLKLPLNLTTQKNQGGEFTDIGFLYLALLPIVFLFLPYRKKQYVYITSGVSTLGFLAFFFPYTAFAMTSFMADITLPGGYIIIFAVFLFWLILNLILDTNKKLIPLFQLNLVFAMFYTFLWTLSAFGIVWYGIVMYLSFLIMIGISVYYICSYKEGDNSKTLQVKLFGSIIIFLIFSFSFIMSAIPHALVNLKGASYPDYKKSEISANESLFGYQNGYLEAIYALNVDPEKKGEFLKDAIADDDLYAKISGAGELGILQTVNILKRATDDTQFRPSERAAAAQGVQNIYEKILTPHKSYENTKNIYRIGTFLKYYITQNNARILNDSLLFQYSDYLYDPDPVSTLENLKKVGLDYVLVDLNAATIDKDSRRNLTKRYEKLLRLFPAEKMELITTDSMCLRLGLQRYKSSEKGEIDRKEFLKLGGVNYESYNENNEVTYRTEKLGYCYSEIAKILNDDQKDLSQEGYGFLLPLKNFLLSPEGKKLATNNTELMKFFTRYVPSGRFALFKIK